jgi:hypothetical protein
MSQSNAVVPYRPAFALRQQPGLPFADYQRRKHFRFEQRLIEQELDHAASFIHDLHLGT